MQIKYTTRNRENKWWWNKENKRNKQNFEIFIDSSLCSGDIYMHLFPGPIDKTIIEKVRLKIAKEKG